MKEIALSNEIFEGCVSVEKTETGQKPWRLPHDKRALFATPGDALVDRLETTSGVRLHFKTNARTICLEVDQKNMKENPGRYDLVIDNQLVQSVAVNQDNGKIAYENLPQGENVVEIWLPVFCGVTVKSLKVDDAADAVVVPDERLKWITYGSSITHCGAAHSPCRTWPATAARHHSLNLTSLGVGGNCHIEAMVARMIRDLPADLITLKLGINVQGGSSMSPRTFKIAIIGFIETIREKHPTTPIAVISPIISPPREETDNAVGLSLTKMRVEAEDAVKRIIETDNDQKLMYFSGLDVFGEDLVGPRLPDNLHPDGDGYEIMGQNVADTVLPKLLEMV